MFAHVCSCLFMFAHFCSLHICSEKSANISKHIKATKSPMLANTVKAQMSDVVEADSAMLYVLSFIVFTSRGKVITVNALLQQSVIRDSCWRQRKFNHYVSKFPIHNSLWVPAEWPVVMDAQKPAYSANTLRPLSNKEMAKKSNIKLSKTDTPGSFIPHLNQIKRSYWHYLGQWPGLTDGF